MNVATVELRPNPNALERQGDPRRLNGGASVKGLDLGSVVRELNEKLEAVKYDRGYHAEVLGEYQERQAAQSRLRRAGGLARRRNALARIPGRVLHGVRDRRPQRNPSTIASIWNARRRDVRSRAGDPRGAE
jgi:hypothetical protein